MANRHSAINLGCAAVILLMGAVACTDGSPLSPSDTSLRGIRWSLIEINGTRVTTSATAPTVLFGDDSRATGFAGCNHFTATYSLGSSNLRLSAIAMTRMYCVETMELEGRYVSALESTRTYRVTGSRLELLNDRDIVVALFEKR